MLQIYVTLKKKSYSSILEELRITFNNIAFYKSYNININFAAHKKCYKKSEKYSGNPRLPPNEKKIEILKLNSNIILPLS